MIDEIDSRPIVLVVEDVEETRNVAHVALLLIQ